MQSQHKKWTKKFTGNDRIFNDVKNPLRRYVEVELKSINIQNVTNRPQKPVDLSIGDPTNSEQFRTNPSNIDILRNNVGKIDGYTKFVGTDQARQSIAHKFHAHNYKIGKQNVFLCAGGSLALWESIMLLAGQGDNFIFPSPGFPLSCVISAASGIQVKFYHLDPHNHWKADLQEMQSLIDQKTKFIAVNDPSNPLGSCWPQQHKKQIIDLARRKNLPLVVDEIYESVTYGDPIKTFAQLSTEQVTIFKCSGLTKRWLGPGWRMGWIIVYATQQNLQKYSTALRNMSNVFLMPHTIVQSSIKQILANPTNDQYLHNRMKIMEKNQNLLADHLKGEKYCHVGSASGALYATILLKMNTFDHNKIPNIVQFCKLLYAQENVMIFPGKFFGSQQTFIRLTISCSNAIIEQFIVRFKRFCHRHFKN